MPLLSGGGKTQWIITGLFLLFSFFIVAMTEVALPAMVIFPGLYCLYAEKIPVRSHLWVAVIPLVLAVVPAMRFGVLMYGALLVTGIIMQMLLRKGHAGLAVALPTTLFFSLFVLAVVSIARQESLSFQGVLSQWAARILDEVQVIYQGVLSQQDMAVFRTSRPVLQERIAIMFPSIVLTSTATMLWMNLLIVSRAFKNIVLSAWKAPDWVVAVFILASILTLVKYQSAHVIGLNLLISVGQIYFFQGLAIVACFMNERRWPGFIRWPLYILVLIQIYIMIVVAGLGLFDTWFDFRKRIRTAKGDEQ
ncbi:MAG: DUF2232 domain-containing protein [Syntrophaceae bacterium]|nr:YybS family protein [Deltaproteobacteria bacterium]